MLDIIMLTYNHQDYIEKAIEGVKNQVVNFNFRLLIFDDYSSDNTEKIIKKNLFHTNDKLEIIYFRNNKNFGASLNGFIALSKVNSKYIALCEGDDYWINPYKLQKQVDFLEKHIDYSMCFHNSTESFNGKLKRMTFCELINKQTFSLEDFMFNHIVPTASIVYRNNIEIPEWFKKVSSGDKLLIFLNAIHGRIYYMNEIMSHYNVTDNGVSRSKEHSGLNKVYNMSYMLMKFDEFTKFKYSDILKKSLNYEINIHILDPFKKDLKTRLLIKEIFTRLLIKYFNYKRKS